MAAKTHQLYGFSIDEAMKLTPQQLAFLDDNAKKAAEQLYLASPDAQQALKDYLAPVTRSVRAQLGGSATPPGPPPTS